MELEKLLLERGRKKQAIGIYSTSRWLSFLSVPWFIFMLNDLYRPSLFEIIFAAGLPVLPYLLVIGSKTSHKDPFISGHAKQALFIVGLRFLSAVFVAWQTAYGDEVLAMWSFLLVNGGLWFFGNERGIQQVYRGRCWWLERKNPDLHFDLQEMNLYQLDQAIAKAQKEPREAAETSGPAQKTGPAGQAGRQPGVRMQPLSDDDRKTIETLAEAFRVGNAAERAEAARRLEALGAVEEF